MNEDEQQETTREKLRRAIQAGFDSGPVTPLTQEDWDEIRREVKSRRPKQTQ